MLVAQDNLDGKWTRYTNEVIAADVSSMTRYYDRVIQWLPREHDSGELLRLIENHSKQIIETVEGLPDLSTEKSSRTAIVLNGVLNHHTDIQALFNQAAPKLSRTSRLILVMYNPYLSWLYKLANRFGFRKGSLPSTFVTRTDLNNIARLSGYSITRTRTAAYMPWRLGGLGTLINKIMPSIPLLRWLSFTYIAILQPIKPETQYPSLSCVIPARNERGNIENAILQMPKLPCDVEIIFVEGHSNDNTWEEILRVKEKYANQYTIKALQQQGKGKADAVRLGFANATNDLLTILDADLTMPPSLLSRYYEAYCLGLADFINGSRLVYPMEGEAMRFLNRYGNSFFARALSWILDTRLGDSLCGTKLVARHDYERFIRWRADFGDFDPFGDFELIFPAAVLGLGIIDIPIRYKSRTYGATNISRFRHGLILLKMTIVGFFKIKMA